MTIQPKFHWKFQDKSSATTTVDSVNKIKASLSEAKPSGHGRIGLAMHLLEKKSHVSLGKAVGQFGTGDFTIAFGMKNISTHGDNELDIIGSQTMKGHGNFFSVRLSDERIFFHVDEDSKAKHYVKVQTDRLSMVPDQVWFHVTVVRRRRLIRIYINGVHSATAKSKTGIANIKNNTDVKLGDSRRGTPNAQYEDLRIYDRALNATEVKALIPQANRPLRAGEIELIAADGAAVIRRKDVGHLSRFSREFKALRVGPDTAVALFNKPSFEGTSQLLYADLPDIRLSRLKDFPASVRIRSAIGEPFTGKWLIKAPNGEFLSFANAPLFRNRKRKSVLRTSSKRSFNALFKLQQPSKQARTQLVHDGIKETTSFRVSPEAEAIPLFVEELKPLSGEFAIVNEAENKWLAMGKTNTFEWTDQKEKRAVFARVAKMADKENQVGELAPGEVALYEHVAYHGRTWILSDTEKDLSGEYPDLSVFLSLQDETSSIRLGPQTGVTVFREDKFHSSLDGKPVPQFDRAKRLGERQSSAFRNIREKVKEAAEKAQEAAKASLVEDIVKNVPNLADSQIGDETISSLKIFRTVEPEDVFSSYTTKLSQDYKMVGNKLKEFSAYRTTLRFEPGDSQAGRKVRVEVSATDSTKIEVEGTIYKINEQKSVVLSPNAMNRIMITSEADGLNTPGLKIRTNAMALNERVVIFPNQEAHQQIAALEDGALWNAKDAKGNFIVDREAHSREEVASVQNTIKRVMATVAYADETSDRRSSSQAADSQSSAKRSSVARAQAVRVGVARSQGTLRAVKSSSRVVSGATIGQPWKIELGAAGNTNRPLSAKSASRSAGRAVGGVTNEGNGQNLAASTPKTVIQETEISQDAFAQLLSRAIPEETSPNSPGFNSPRSKPTTPNLIGPAKFIKISNPFPTIRDAITSGASATIGFFEDAVNVLVDTAQGVFRFVVDTVEKVAEFVEAVVEKVVEKIKQFIEFLQFLFDWDDILDTQRYLKRVINTSLDSAKQLAVDAKPHVTSFVDDLQNGVEGGMNQLVEKLGGKPSEVEESGFELPEALEWFLSKFIGGSNPSDSDTTSDDGNGESPLASFVRQMLEAFEDAVGAGLQISEGMFDSIQTLIANPREPEAALIVIIEAFRDAIIQSLDAVENVTLGLLDMVRFAVDLFQDFLNAEIRVPFISDLLDFVGVGKLTVLNMATIVLAIPATVIAKLVAGENLFTERTPVPLDLANQPLAFADVTTNRAALSDSSISNSLNASNDLTDIDLTDEPDSLRDLRKDLAFTVLVTLADTANHIVAGILDTFDVPGFEVDGDNSNLSNLDQKLGSRAKKNVTPLKALEVTSIVLSLMSWSFSKPEPGELTKEKRREIALWSYRGGILAMDTLLLAVNNLERMRRVEEKGFNMAWALLSFVDLILYFMYLETVTEENDTVRRAEISNEIFSALPHLTCFLRSMAKASGEPITKLALHLLHVATDGAAAIATLATGSVLIREADKALNAAKAAR